MYSLQKQFHDFIKQHDLLRKGENVLVAVSGGLDSIVLADLFLKSEWHVAVAHCNYGLRGKESDEDESFVKKWAKKNRTEVYTRKFNLGEGSAQLNARYARYDWFNELCVENGYEKISTAHHLNDSLETILINLTRGTGIKGVAGIQPLSGNVIRPLLSVSKNQLKGFALENGLHWREDSSNLKTDYDRNMLRLEVIPKLQELHPSLVETFRNTIERLRMSNDIIQREVDQIRETQQVTKSEYVELKLGWIERASHLVILSEILSGYGLNYATSKKIFESMGKPGKVFFSKAYEISMGRKSLFIRSNEVRRSAEIEIKKTGIFSYEEKTLELDVVEREEVTFERSTEIGYFDFDKMVFPIKIRRWKEGDRFKPLGLNGSKKISDYLIDKKVPVALKENISVLISEGEIAWLIGHQISDGFKITDKTKSILKICLKG